MPPRNPFAVLGLPVDATADSIKAAWRRLARENHPDTRSGDPALERPATRRMAEINAAYQELRDPEKRRVHREAAARESRAAGAAGAGANGTNGGAGWAGEPDAYAPPTWVPRPRPTRPVTARIDTSELFHPRNSTLHPLDRSPLPGLPPRPRSLMGREAPRASDPTGPMLRRQGRAAIGDAPSLADALSIPLTFGKFEGHTLGDVATTEPSYVEWIVRTIDRDPDLLLAARVVLRFLERSGAARRRRLDTETMPRR